MFFQLSCGDFMFRTESETETVIFFLLYQVDSPLGRGKGSYYLVMANSLKMNLGCNCNPGWNVM